METKILIERYSKSIFYNYGPKIMVIILMLKGKIYEFQYSSNCFGGLAL
jgi:hypothetical protein